MKLKKLKLEGFTLIELLVVIAIISILAGLIFPVFVKAKLAAKTTTTLSNIRQLGMGFSLYEEDNDDGLPNVADGFPGVGRLDGWTYYSEFSNSGSTAGKFDVSRGTIYQYVNSKQIYQSANDPGAKESGLSFAYNGCLVKTPFQLGFNSSINAGSAANPSSMMLIGEEGTSGSLFASQSGTNDGFLNPETDQFAEWHSGGTALAFLDGHAKVMKARDRFREVMNGDPNSICW